MTEALELYNCCEQASQYFYSYRPKFLNGISLQQDAIYHYTSPNGLKAIIQNKAIRFSSHYCLNDKRELQYFIDILLSQLEAEKGTYQLTYFYDLVKNTYKKDDFFNNIITTFYYQKPNNQLSAISDFYQPFIFSTSTEPDELSLWNYYSKSENNGYNIEFCFKSLYQHLDKMLESVTSLVLPPNKANSDTERVKYLGDKLFYGKVIYDKEKQIEIINEILRKFYDFSDKCKDKEEYYLQNIFPYLKWLISTCVFFYKEQCFQMENEYRIVIVLPHLIYDKDFYNEDHKKIMHMEYPIINSCFSPKLEISFDSWKWIISSIRIGPRGSLDFAKKGLNDFLDHNGLPGTPIITSNIPVRF